MTCTTVTVVAGKPVISNLVASPNTDPVGYVNVSWSQDIAGSVNIKVDSAIVQTVTGSAGSQAVMLTGLSVGTHNICIDAA